MARTARRRSATIEARQADRRDTVLDAAMRIVERQGLEALSAAALAEAVGVVPAALYRTFASMDAVRGALVVRALERVDDELRAAVGELRVPSSRPAPLTQAKARALARVVAAARVLQDLRERAPAVHRLVDLALSAPVPFLDDETALAVEARLQRVLFHVARALDDAAAVGALAPGDAELRTSALLAVAHGADHLVKRDRLVPPRLTARRVHEEAVRALLVGWGAAP